jgi:hypothetical protein
MYQADSHGPMGPLLLALIMLTACDQPASNGGDEAAPDTSAAAQKDPESIAKSTVARTLGISPADVKVVSSDTKDFSDSSLDCPEPGMSYLQVITPGHVIIVEGEGRRFDVRVSGSMGRICHRRKPGAPNTKRSDTSATSKLIDLARQDLAAKLHIKTDEISVQDVRPFNAEFPLTGCSPDCADNTDNCGVVISLYADGRNYSYHVNGDQAMPCPAILNS